MCFWLTEPASAWDSIDVRMLPAHIWRFVLWILASCLSTHACQSHGLSITGLSITCERKTEKPREGGSSFSFPKSVSEILSAALRYLIPGGKGQSSPSDEIVQILERCSTRVGRHEWHDKWTEYLWNDWQYEMCFCFCIQLVSQKVGIYFKEYYSCVHQQGPSLLQSYTIFTIVLHEFNFYKTEHRSEWRTAHSTDHCAVFRWDEDISVWLHLPRKNIWGNSL